MSWALGHPGPSSHKVQILCSCVTLGKLLCLSGRESPCLEL